MPKQWVSRTIRTCVPGIQAAGLRPQPSVRAPSVLDGTVGAHLILATVSATEAEFDLMRVALTSDGFREGLRYSGP
jgi:hypothetical protein